MPIAAAAREATARAAPFMIDRDDDPMPVTERGGKEPDHGSRGGVAYCMLLLGAFSTQLHLDPIPHAQGQRGWLPGRLWIGHDSPSGAWLGVGRWASVSSARR